MIFALSGATNGNAVEARGPRKTLKVCETFRVFVRGAQPLRVDNPLLVLFTN
jgi:hypothetical protein